MPADRGEPRATRRPSYRIADRLTEADVLARLRCALAGLDPIDAVSRTAARPAPVVWEDAGDAVLVHLDSVKVRLVDRMVVASVDLESDETGRGAIIVRLVFGAVNDGAELIASTDEVAHGHAALAGRWGGIMRDVVWAVLCGTAAAHARERGLAPRALRVTAGQLRFATRPDRPLPDRLGTKLPPRPAAPPVPPTPSRPR